MKVLALNGSPRMKASSTHQLLSALLAGMQKAGAETELVELRKLNLEPCIGCFSCWLRIPGRCIHEDVMDELLPQRFCKADLVVFGTPLYHYNMSGTMKVFVDRTLPQAEPWLVQHKTHRHLTTHPERWPSPRKMFLVSACGFPEYEHFDGLVRTFRQIARSMGSEYAGELLRPAAEPLSQKSMLPLFKDYLEVVERAGSELIRDGRIGEALQKELRVELPETHRQAFYDLAAGYWNEKMDRFKLPQSERHVAPLLPHELVPDALPVAAAQGVDHEAIARGMAALYNAATLPGLRCTLQLHFAPAAGETQRSALDWFLDISEDRCTVHPGTTPFPSLRIFTPAETWHAIGAGQLDAEQAFTEGRYEARGNLDLLRALPRLFTYPR